MPWEKHAVGKADISKIERKNISFRTHIKRLNRKLSVFQRIK
ncbi:MAG: IS1 family transposase [Candidatus Electronema sp. VV]